MKKTATKAGFWVVAALTALAGTAIATAQPFPPGPRDQRATVAGWRVVHVHDEDGGRDVGMSTYRDGVRIDYYVNYWRGNGRPFQRAAIMRDGENCGGEQWDDGAQPLGFALEPDVAGDGRRIRERLAGHLAECGVDPAQAERVLRGFAAAFARLAVMAESARRYTLAVSCSIEHHPEGPSVVRRRCDRR